MQSNSESSENFLGTIALYTASALTMFGVYYATRPGNDEQSKAHSKCITGQNLSEITSSNFVQEAMDNYADIIAAANKDKAIVLAEMRRQRQEMRPYIGDKEALVARYKQLQSMFSRFGHFSNEASKKITDVELQGREMQELINMWEELMGAYPKAAFEDMDEDDEALQDTTLEEVEEACKAYEEHHARVVNIAEQMLLRCDVDLNEERVKESDSFRATT